VLRRGALMRRYRRALKAAGVEPGHRFHDLRHTFGTANGGGGGADAHVCRSGWAIGTSRRCKRYADYAPNEREVEMVDRAFGDLDGA
jgi:integrase